MKTMSSLFVLFLLGSLIADAAAQTRPRPPGQGQNPPPGHQQPPHQQPPGHQSLPPYTQPLPPIHIPGQQTQIISERVMMNLSQQSRISVSELLHLSPYEEMGLKIRTLTLSASSAAGRGSLAVLSLGRSVSGVDQILPRYITDVRVILPLGARISDLELVAQGNIYLDTITAEVESQYGPGPGPGPIGQIRQPYVGETLLADVNQSTRLSASIDLEQILKRQQRITLEGASIDRIVVRGSSFMNRSATAQIELNGRLIGQAKPLLSRPGGVPFPIKSFEEVRSLRLIVRGDAAIDDVNIVIGQVRPIRIGHGGGHGGGHIDHRISVMRTISANMPLQLSHLLPYESRLVSSITLEASSQGRAQVAILGSRGEVVASTMVNGRSGPQVLHLARPMMVRELSIESLTMVTIETLELQFDSFNVW